MRLQLDKLSNATKTWFILLTLCVLSHLAHPFDGWGQTNTSASITNMTIGVKETVISASARSNSLYAWPDGTIGVLRSGDQYTFYAANSSSVGKAVGTLANPVQNSASSISISNMKNGYNYQAGGPVYRDPATGTLIMIYHAERWIGGDATRFWSLLGMAKSTNDGNTWTDLGEIISPNVPFGNSPHEITGGTYAFNDGYMYVYFRDLLQTGTTNNMAVARARVADVVSAAGNNTVTTFNKYQGGNWSQPGLGGTSSNLESGNPGANFMSVSYNNYSGKYIMAVVGGSNWNVYLTESADGLNWSSRVLVENESGESYAPSVIGIGNEPKDSDQQFYIYYVYSIAGGFNRWSDATIVRRIVTLNGPTTTPPPTTPPPAFNYNLSNSGNISVTTGQSVSNTITATLSSGTAQALSFTVSGFPTGVSGSFSQNSCTPTCSTLLTISAQSTTPTGSSTMTVTAVGGPVTQISTFTLTVNPPTTPPPTQTPGSFVTHFDAIPDFTANPTISSALSGPWSNPGTWTPARVPGPNDIVKIKHAVTYDSTTGDTDVIGIDAGGTLRFTTSQTTRLRVGTVLILPNGALEIGTPSNPVSPTVTAEIIIKNKALNTTTDPNEYGTGILSVDGKVTIHGAIKSPTFVRLGSEPRAGQSILQLQQAVSGWQPGDRLILPDTRHLRDNEVQNWQVIQPQWEELTVQSVSSDGRTLTLTRPLTFDHLGARDGNGNLDFLPHAGNFSRNVIVRSENPIGSGGVQGHVLLTSRTSADVRYGAFRDLGRTRAEPTGAGNHIGRYPMHMHHVMGPTTTPANGYQFTLIGNAVDGGSTTHNLRWGIAVHDSHYGLIQDNVAYNYNGWIIGTEDGSESYNVFDHNFVVRSNGSGGRNGGDHETNEGGGFTFRGPNNYVRNNVAANIMSNGPDAAYGFKFAFMYLGNINIPNFKGADTSVSGQYTTKDGNSLPVLEFADNEIYGATGSGFSYWWVGTFGSGYPRATQDSVFRNLRIWHVFNKGIFHYEAMRIIYDGLVIRGKDPAANPACCGEGVAMNDYTAQDVTFRNVDIQGMGLGLTASTVSGGGLQTIENSYFRNLTNYSQGTIWTSGADSSGVPPRKVINRNTRFAAWPGSTLKAIVRIWEPARPSSTNTTQRDELLVYDYQGQVGNNFQVYYKEQATQNIAGGRAPCNDTTSRPEINGITCPITGGTPPPPLTVPATPTLYPVGY